MAKSLDTQSRDILNFKPRISFVEPDVLPEDIPAREPVRESSVSRESLQNLAQSVDILATAAQAQVDLRAKNVKIALDPVVDANVVSAMERQFPDDNPYEITFQQYRKLKEKIREEGLAIANQTLITPEAVSSHKDNARKALDNQINQSVLQMGGNGTPEAELGLLRPELIKEGQIFKPLNLPDLQLKLVCVLANFIWKSFLIKAFDISVKGIGIKRLLPKKICNPGSKIEIPDIMILGQKKENKKKQKKNEKQPKLPKLPKDPKVG